MYTLLGPGCKARKSTRIVGLLLKAGKLFSKLALFVLQTRHLHPNPRSHVCYQGGTLGEKAVDVLQLAPEGCVWNVKGGSVEEGRLCWRGRLLVLGHFPKKQESSCSIKGAAL